MNFKPIIIVAGEPNSIFFEIYIKALRSKKFKTPLILIASFYLIKLQMKKMNIKKKIRCLNFLRLGQYKLDNNYINLIDIKYNQSKPFEKISIRSNDYITKSFNLALKIVKKNFKQIYQWANI